ncbi:acetolactate synthase large subunit [Mycobacterium sp. CBMA 234]|uniref:acetolactate synthase large subunit n=1 Tax=Mycolicibacterium sp. CBMA 234 TaxID=1918495 RepID=UPI0012DD48E8|nr:acetolactate synthase large subunit [Mycolicibacterium sp. CBMA 234]MUL67137.1 acetolactate synthase large subunit [Mycolicibacterium sp. CBMA 234]
MTSDSTCATNDHATTSGAQALLGTLVDAGVSVTFTNPGTSEMHFVAALDGVPDMRAVLTLFEGVATGAADGYARMARRPAATLLHLGPGLGNGLANLHNARKARSPMVNIIGEHATDHGQFDTPLQSDIHTVARNVSTWIRTPATAAELPAAAAAAVSAATSSPPQIATLIVPADASWNSGVCAAPAVQPDPPQATDPAALGIAADALRNGQRTALLLGGAALTEPALLAAARIAAVSGATLLAETFPARMPRGAGLPSVQRLAYLSEMSTAQLDGLQHLILVDAAPPRSFFAYPGRPSNLVPEDCQVHQLTTAAQDSTVALGELAEILGAKEHPLILQPPARPGRPDGPLTADTVCQAIGHLLPEHAIISDEAQTSGFGLPAATAGAPRHDLLTLTGGAIGQGLPVAIGAAVACPDRPVLALQADGSALYTVQSLWTIAREELDVTVVLLNNRSYAILAMELNRVGVGQPGTRAKAQLDLSQPPIDFTALSAALGIPATRAQTTEEFLTALERAFTEPGPHLIEAIIPSVVPL